MTRLTRLVSLLVLWLLAPATARLEVPVEEYTLANGLHVILQEDHSVPLVALNLTYFVGSANERAGRSGLAHFFEHVLFKGSAHVADGDHDRLLHARGGVTQGTTVRDRTSYTTLIPPEALELALYLESDRMGFLEPALTPEKIDLVREVVKNEKRETFDNAPYGAAAETISPLLFPSPHPYRWTPIGAMEDLDAAEVADFIDFYRRNYGPGNASLVISGDIDPKQTRVMVERWFGGLPGGTGPVPPPRVEAAKLEHTKRVILSDAVTKPRLYVLWPTPARLQPDDAALTVLAELLSSSGSWSLYSRINENVHISSYAEASQNSLSLNSYFAIVVTGDATTNVQGLSLKLQTVLAEMVAEPPDLDELQGTLRKLELDFLDRMESLEGRAQSLNDYYRMTGKADFFASDWARYQSLTPADIQRVARQYLTPVRVELSILPEEAP